VLTNPTVSLFLEKEIRIDVFLLSEIVDMAVLYELNSEESVKIFTCENKFTLK
jgi:phosphorylcholine metabolism protein LicD